MLTAVLSGVVWLSAQYALLTGSFREGLDYILWSFGKRVHGLAQYDYEPVYERSIHSNQWDVLMAYLNDHAFHVQHWFNSQIWKHVSIITFTFCILLFVLMSFFSLTAKAIQKNEAFYRRQKALVVTLWVSLLAPLSWFIIFKGHSAIHTHMNPIVWYMPFLLFGFVMDFSTFWRIFFHRG